VAPESTHRSAEIRPFSTHGFDENFTFILVRKIEITLRTEQCNTSLVMELSSVNPIYYAAYNPSNRKPFQLRSLKNIFIISFRFYGLRLRFFSSATGEA
jgi:hypothetical protein